MLHMFLGAFIIILMWLGPKALAPIVKKYWARYQYQRWLKSPTVQSRLQLLATIYQPISGYEISKQARAERGEKDASYTYGEITFIPFVGILDLIPRVSDGVFYDLGSGTGKAVLTAALFGNFKEVIGIESLAALHREARKALAKLLSSIQTAPLAFQYPTKISFVEQDILTYDFTNASMLYVNATCFSDELWTALQEKFDALAPGTILIVVSRELRTTNYQLLHQLTVDMSWGPSQMLLYQRKADEPSS